MNNFQKFAHPAHGDPVFKHLMFQDDIRNAFLSAALKKTILSSQMADPSLSPFDDHHQARSLIEELIKKGNTQRLERLFQTVEEADRPLLQKIMQCLPLIHEMFPDKQRLTTLDVVCRTTDHLINVEIQCASQHFWDLRMLVHGGGLVFKQIKKGFNWEEISKEGTTVNKHKETVPAFRETIVIGLLLNPPIYRPAASIFAMPWYETEKWKEGEVGRVFHICKDNELSVRMPGLMFHQYNLSAVSSQLVEKEETGENKRLLQWLDLFGHSGEKCLNDVKYLEREEPALWKAYEMLTHLPENIARESEENKKMYQLTEQQKDLYTQIGLETGEARGEARGEEKGRLEVAKTMLHEGVALEIISKFTKLSIEQLEALKNTL